MLDVAVLADARDRRHVRACEDQAIAHHPPLLRLPKEATRVEPTYAGMRKFETFSFETFRKVDSTDLDERYLSTLTPVKTCILDQPDPKLHSGSTVLHPCSWAHPNADSVPSRLGIGGRFRAMPVELVSVYAGVPIPGVPGTKLGF